MLFNWIADDNGRSAVLALISLNAVRAICVLGCEVTKSVLVGLRIIVSVSCVQIDCWLSVINGGYNYVDLLRDSSPHVKVGEKNIHSDESNAAFLERFVLPPASLRICYYTC